MNKLSTWLAVVIAAATILGGIYAWDKDVVKTGDLSVVRKDLTEDLFVVSEDLRLLKKQYTWDGDTKRVREIEGILWTIKERYKDTPMPVTTRETKHRLEVELRELLHKLGRS